SELLQANGDTLSEYYSYTLSLSPNLISTLLYTTFSFLFSQKVTYMLVHLLIWISLPISVYYVLRFSRKENGFLALLVLPFLYTFPFIMGFDSFCLGLSAALLLYGYWLRKRQEAGWKYYLLIGLFATALYFTHLVAVCFFLLLVIMHLLISGFIKNVIHNQFENKSKLIKEGVGLIPFLPLILLLVCYFLNNSDSSTSLTFSFANLDFNKLIKMDDLNLFWSAGEGSYLKYLALFLLTLGAISIVMGFFQKQKSRVSLSWFTVVVCLLLYFFIPDALAGGSFISNRLILIFFISLIIALGSVKYSTALKYSIMGIGIYLSMALYLNKAPYFNRFDQEISRFISVLENVDEHSTVLYLNYHPSGVDESMQAISYGKGLFHHAAAFISYQKEDVVLLKNYETYHPYFPVKWKDEMSANVFLACAPFALSADPPCANFEVYNSGERSVDYVFVYTHPDKVHTDENSQRMHQYIEANYELISEEKSGIIRLFKRI
ncbi:MAG: hypothetical protein WD530_04780, partial [Vicingaceae bacterium]